MKILKKTKVTIEGDKVFDAYVAEDMHWNGFEVPYFELGVAIEVCKYLHGFRFDLERDAAIDEPQEDDDFEPYYYVGQNLLTENGYKHLYPVGGCLIIWSKSK